jgi:PBP1b-binding outer membrane lipoprotein LpoB
MKKRMLLIVALLLALLLAACGNDDEAEAPEEPEETEETESAEQEVSQEVEIAEEEVVEADRAVASVNGTEINGSKYNNIYRQLKTMLHMYGQDVSDTDMLREETLAILTEQELLRQDAVESGIEVTEEEAQEEIDLIRETNGEEAIEAMLAEYELTEDQFREQMVDDLITIRYIESEFEVEVTDEEVEEQYALLQEESEEEIGELEEYESFIRQTLTEEKQSDMLEVRIDELREEAEIETFI